MVIQVDNETVDKQQVLERLESLTQTVEKRMSYIAGYCPKTGEAHTYSDLDTLSFWNLLGYYPCDRCGKRVDPHEKKRLRAVSKIADAIEEAIEDVEHDFTPRSSDLSYSDYKKYRIAKRLLEYDEFQEANEEQRRTLVEIHDSDLGQEGITRVLEFANQIECGDIVQDGRY